MEQTHEALDYRFRLLYALGMVFIVSGHCNGGGVNLFYDWFSPYGFHLGLFVFCAGYFYKDSYEQDLTGFLLRKAKSLLLPMYLWNLFYALLVLLLRKFGFTIGMLPSFQTLVTMPLYEGSQFEYNMGAWFVVPLFTVEVMTVLFSAAVPCVWFMEKGDGGLRPQSSSRRAGHISGEAWIPARLGAGRGAGTLFPSLLRARDLVPARAGAI